MSEEMAYIARTTAPSPECPIVGYVVAACVDMPKLRRETAKTIAKWVRDGLAIERVPTDVARRLLMTADPTPQDGGKNG